jgi:hypothetical protein
LKLSKGLLLLVAISITMLLVGFAGGLLSAPSLGFAGVETVTKQVPILITETVTLVDTTTVTSTITETATQVEIYTSTVTATDVQTVFLETTITVTRIVTMTINIPATVATTPFARVSRGSSIRVNDWTISVALRFQAPAPNTSTSIVSNTTSMSSAYHVVVLQLRNDAPWARTIDLTMFSRVVLVTSSSRSYEPIAINTTKMFIAPGSYGFVEAVFSIDKNEFPSYLYTEIIGNGMPVRVEFEL